MATSASFHGVVGLQNGSRYQIDKKNYWRHDAFIATPELGDVRINVFTFGASAEDGIYLLDARTTSDSDPIIDDEGLVRNARMRVTALHRQFVEV
ncbi:uncharacterized protein F5147DRAFT_838078 [Suillus discolor]|uniref:Uncharacterized protein n=1 Tax=Suillus discolor TaxID=1912936 RepID=A0A9P7JSV7_9AGAM|nr:uncharacterized protein F5147DRAFT_838078 [Suillus discolor]KAG2105469.1 hypothetical protein F5147DRAFT_838078 [Suillus discolor]